MAKLTIEDLKSIKEKKSKKTLTYKGDPRVKVIVHMGTCGIAAGAREVMNALMDEMNQTDRRDIRVIASGCLGMCSSEPNVTVEVNGKKPIIYQRVNSNKMRQIFRRHILLEEVQTDFALARAEEE